MVLFLTFFFSIDATYSEGLGRLINDSPTKFANCKIKKIKIEKNTSGNICHKRNKEWGGAKV